MTDKNSEKICKFVVKLLAVSTIYFVTLFSRTSHFNFCHNRISVSLFPCNLPLQRPKRHVLPLAYCHRQFQKTTIAFYWIEVHSSALLDMSSLETLHLIYLFYWVKRSEIGTFTNSVIFSLVVFFVATVSVCLSWWYVIQFFYAS